MREIMILGGGLNKNFLDPLDYELFGYSIFIKAENKYMV
jgi:hypothetical protein